jgi:hypothetical protein
MRFLSDKACAIASCGTRLFSFLAGGCFGAFLRPVERLCTPMASICITSGEQSHLCAFFIASLQGMLFYLTKAWFPLRGPGFFHGYSFLACMTRKT